MARWDGETYRDGWVDDDAAGGDDGALAAAIDCWAQPPCARYENAFVNSSARSDRVDNCTVLTRRDEHCLPCPLGSWCAEQVRRLRSRAVFSSSSLAHVSV